MFGLEPQGKKAAYLVTEVERAWAVMRWPRTVGKVTGERVRSDRREAPPADLSPSHLSPFTSVPRVAVQVQSSSEIKGYPRLFETLGLLNRQGVELVLVGQPRERREPVPPGVVDGTQEGWTIRQSLAMVAQCDAVLGADSMLIHAAHALGLPAVGLFGPFDGESYMAGYAGSAMQGLLGCSPCHWHGRTSRTPPGKPCEATGQCVALGQRTPEAVVLRVMRVLGEAGKVNSEK